MGYDGWRKKWVPFRAVGNKKLPNDHILFKQKKSCPRGANDTLVPSSMMIQGSFSSPIIVMYASVGDRWYP